MPNDVAYWSIPDQVNPTSTWGSALREIEQGEHDRLFEDAEDQTGFDTAWEYYHELARDAPMRVKGYVEVARPMPDGEGYAVMVSLSQKGYDLAECLRQGLVWLDGAPSQEATHAFWQNTVERAWWADYGPLDELEYNTHPWTEEARKLLTPKRIELWIRTIQAIEDPNSKTFETVMALPDDPFSPVKAEAVHHRIKIWTPR